MTRHLHSLPSPATQLQLDTTKNEHSTQVQPIDEHNQQDGTWGWLYSGNMVKIKG